MHQEWRKMGVDVFCPKCNPDFFGHIYKYKINSELEISRSSGEVFFKAPTLGNAE